MPGVQIRRHRGQVLDVSILGANRAAPPSECPRRRSRSPHTRAPAGPGLPSAAAIGRRVPAISAVGEEKYKFRAPDMPFGPRRNDGVRLSLLSGAKDPKRGLQELKRRRKHLTFTPKYAEYITGRIMASQVIHGTSIPHALPSQSRGHGQARVYPGFPTPFWGLSGFCVGDSMGKSLWKLVENTQRFPRRGGRVLCVHGAVSFHRARPCATR